MSSAEGGDALSVSLIPEISPKPDSPRKHTLTNTEELTPSKGIVLEKYSPAKTRVVKVLRNDANSKTIFLLVKFADCSDQDAIIILQKSAFPSDIDGVCKAQIGQPLTENASKESHFSTWEANEVSNNDIYRRINVVAGLEPANSVNMTIIHPAEPHHILKYTASRRLIIQETPKVYNKAVIPFLASHPKDLSWVDNLLNGTAEVERVLFTDDDAAFGFNFSLDYKWDGRQINELHALSLVRDPSLMCLRDLTANHVPMLKKMLEVGRRELVAKYGGQDGEPFREDQIIAYFHYPPTFYRLHMHFVHIDGPMDGGTRAGKAHIAEDVIANLEMQSEYYAKRTLLMYLTENHPFLAPIRKFQEEGE